MKVDFYFNDQPSGSQEIGEALSRIAVPAQKKSGLRKIFFQLPILDFQGYWKPDLRYPGSKIFWIIESRTAAQSGYPLLTFFNAAQENKASIAVDNLRDDVRITAKMNQENCTYDVTVLVAEQEDSPDYTLTLDRRSGISWMQAVADWGKSLKLPPRNFPAGAWDPVYCTWYVVHGAVTQDWVEETVKKAVPMGFKTLIIDDGWSYDEKKRVSPETIGTWYDSIGNWTVSKAKFPDFPAHVKRVQKMGMHYMVWTAPFLIGDKSELIDDFLKDKAVLTDRHTEGCYTFDTACKDKWNILINKLTDLMKDYGLDGLKIDFLDYIYPMTERPRGAETFDFISKLSRSIREVKPDALMEFRQGYNTPQMLSLATQFRAGDVPFDYIDNFARLAQIRVSLGGGDGIPVHADPLYWHPQESPENIARHLIASLGGVPMLSMELKDMSETEKKIIAFWLGFYKEHQTLLNQGHWEVSYHPQGLNYMQVTRDGETAIILEDEARLPQALKAAAGKKLYLLNLSPVELDVPGAQAFDCCGRPVSGNTVPLAGMAELGPAGRA